MPTWGSKSDLQEVQADDWFKTAQESTDAFLKGLGWTGAEPKVDESPALSISLPTAEEYHASAPWRDLDPTPAPGTANGSASSQGVGRTSAVSGSPSPPPTGGQGAADASFSAPRTGDPSGGVEQWDDIVQEASRTYHVPPAYIKGIMHIESGGRTHDDQGRPLRSSAGAISLMQVMPFHFQPGENPDDPRTNVMRGTKILADNFARYGDWDRAAAAYFGAIDEHGNITGASDGNTDGPGYVRQFRDAAGRYAGGPSAPPTAGASSPSAPAAPAPAGVQPAPAGAPVGRGSGQYETMPVTPSTPPATMDRSPDTGTGPPLTRNDPRAEPQSTAGTITVRDKWGNTFDMDADAYRTRPGGTADLTVIRDNRQAAAAPWSPDSPTAAPVSAQMNAGRSAGGTMSRLPLSATGGPDTAPDQPYDPRDADQGAHESGPLPGGYTDAGPATDGTPIRMASGPPTPEETDQLQGTQVQGRLQYPLAGTLAPDEAANLPGLRRDPTDMGPAGPEGDDPGQQQTTRRPAGETYLDLSVPAPPGWAALVDAGGQVVDWVRHKAQDAVDQIGANTEGNRRAVTDANAATGYGQVTSTPGEPDYVQTGNSDPIGNAASTLGTTVANEGIVRPVVRPISNAIRAATGREPLTAETEPVPSIDRAISETARSLGSNVQAVQEGYATGSKGQMALGALGVAGDLAPSMLLARQLNELLPRFDINAYDLTSGESSPLIEGVGVGDVVMTLALAHDAARLGYGAIKVGGRTWSKLAEAVSQGVPVEKFSEWLQGAGEAVGRGARALGEEAARQLMDLTPGPHVIQPGAGGVSRPTVEVARDALVAARQGLVEAHRAVQRATTREARGMADEALIAAKRAETEATQQLQEAQQARRAIEPAIRSDVGRPLASVEPTAADVEMLADAKYPRERVHPDMQASIGPVDDVPRTPSLNSALPFDPSSALAGGASGAASGDDEDGQPDPLRAAAGMFLGAVGNTPQGRRMARQAARIAAQQAKHAAPPNLLEVLQAVRFSWGMLGNFSTGAVNAMGAPIEIGLGLPSEAFRMGVLHQRPAPVVYQAVEAASGVMEGVRSMLATVMGRIPQSVRTSPDFRPPMAERLPGAAGTAAGTAIDLPGRLTSQAPDAFWRPIFERWARTKVAGDIMTEAGVSRLRPDEQIKTMHRWLNDPSDDDIALGIPQRIAEGAKKLADEQQYKGANGYWEDVIGGIVRPGNKTTTAADPVAQQVHEALGSFVMPFFGTIWKLHKLSASRVPGVGFATNRSLPLDEKVSRQLVGAGLGLYIADRAAQGLVTGPGPSDPDEAAIVNKTMPPHHFYVPGVGWLPNQYAGSAGPYLDAIGGYYDARRYATEKEKASADKMGDRIAKDVARGFEQFPVAQAVQSVVAMFESPTRGVTDFLANAGSSFVPAVVKTGAASRDPYTRTIDRETGFADQLGQKLESRTGIGRQNLLPAQDRFGRLVENPRQGAAAFLPNVKNPKDDPLAQVFIDAGIQPGAAPSEVDGVPLTTAQKRAWLTARGEALATRQAALENAARLPEARRAERIQDQLTYASGRGDLAARRLITPEQRAAAKKKAG